MVKKKQEVKGVIAIDPGKKGAICIRYGDTIDLYTMPILSDGKTVDIWALNILFKKFNPKTCRVFIEEAQSMPNQSSVAGFTYGRHFGSLEMLCVCHRFGYVLVRSNAWTKALGFKREKVMVTIKKGKNAGKKRIVKGPKSSIAYVQRKYPNLDIYTGKKKQIVHDGLTDAICLAEYGMFLYKG